MPAGWFKVTISIKVPGKIRPVSKDILVPDNLLVAPVAIGNDHRQDRAVVMVGNAFSDVYKQASDKLHDMHRLPTRQKANGSPGA